MITRPATLGSFTRLRWLVLGGAVIAVSGALVASSRTDRRASVEYLTRFVPEQMARHLVEDDEVEFREYAATMGLDAVGLAYIKLFVAPYDSSVTAFSHAESLLTPACVRLTNTLADEYNFDAVRRRYLAYKRLPVREREHLQSLVSKFMHLPSDMSLPLEQKSQRYLELIEECNQFGIAADKSELYASYCEFLPRLKVATAVLQGFLYTGIQEAERSGSYTAACQMLGQLGLTYGDNGNDDSMRVCWDRALMYARHVKSWQEARILGFYATYYRHYGQMALAREYYLQAQARCRELKADRAEIRYLLATIDFFASLECWELVDHDLQNADRLLRRSDVWDPDITNAWVTRIQLLRAAHDAAVGDCSDYGRLRNSLGEVVQYGPGRWREDARFNAARILVRCMRYEEADSVLAAGREACVALPHPNLLVRYELEIAATRLALGDVPGAEAALQRFREAPSDSTADSAALWLQHDVTWVKAALLQGDRTLAWVRFRQALARAVARQQRLESSPEAYLTWAKADALRDLGRELLGREARSGYAFEMAWRKIRACGNRSWKPIRDGGDSLVQQLQDESGILESAIARAKAIHCVYRVRGKDVVRWVAFTGRVECDTLDVTPEETASWVEEVRRGLLPSARLDGSFLHACAMLGEVLLPPELFEHPEIRRVLISADGVLADLPFSVLSMSFERFQPLITQYEVASLRFHSQPSVAPTGPPLIIYDPKFAPALRRRFSVLKEALPRAAVEASQAQATMPGALVLHGASATKQSILDYAPRAPIIYLASHIIQDPEVPYIAFVPLAAEESRPADESYLELSDIRGIDLSRCRLAVLSGCGSGRGYSSSTATCPSLGEVFVDAGVHAVVQTNGDVRDDDAEALMSEFLRELQREQDSVRALAAAQRRAYQAGGGSSTWATYSITLGGIWDDSGRGL